jgi:hypothetical protein
MTDRVDSYEYDNEYLQCTPSYIDTYWWKERRDQFFQDHGRRCDACGITAVGQAQMSRPATKREIEEYEAGRDPEDGWVSWSGNVALIYRVNWLRVIYPRFHAHHVTYKHLGAERDEDLRLLCEMCHNALHHLERDRNVETVPGMMAERWLGLHPELRSILPTMFPVYPAYPRVTQVGEIE